MEYFIYSETDDSSIDSSIESVKNNLDSDSDSDSNNDLDQTQGVYPEASFPDSDVEYRYLLQSGGDPIYGVWTDILYSDSECSDCSDCQKSKRRLKQIVKSKKKMMKEMRKCNVLKQKRSS